MNPPTPQPDRAEIESRLTALLLGELPAAEADLLRWTIVHDPELSRLHDRLKNAIDLVREVAASPDETVGADARPGAPLRLSEARRQKLLACFKTVTPKEFAPVPAAPRRWKVSWPMALAAVLLHIAVLAVVLEYTAREGLLGKKLEKISVDLVRLDKPMSASFKYSAMQSDKLELATASLARPSVMPPPPIPQKPTSPNNSTLTLAVNNFGVDRSGGSPGIPPSAPIYLGNGATTPSEGEGTLVAIVATTAGETHPTTEQRLDSTEAYFQNANPAAANKDAQNQLGFDWKLGSPAPAADRERSLNQGSAGTVTFSVDPDTHAIAFATDKATAGQIAAELKSLNLPPRGQQQYGVIQQSGNGSGGGGGFGGRGGFGGAIGGGGGYAGGGRAGVTDQRGFYDNNYTVPASPAAPVVSPDTGLAQFDEQVGDKTVAANGSPQPGDYAIKQGFVKLSPPITGPASPNSDVAQLEGNAPTTVGGGVYSQRIVGDVNQADSSDSLTLGVDQKQSAQQTPLPSANQLAITAVNSFDLDGSKKIGEGYRSDSSTRQLYYRTQNAAVSGSDFNGEKKVATTGLGDVPIQGNLTRTGGSTYASVTTAGSGTLVLPNMPPGSSDEGPGLSGTVGGTVALNGGNTYSGGTVVNYSGGTVVNNGRLNTDQGLVVLQDGTILNTHGEIIDHADTVNSLPPIAAGQNSLGVVSSISASSSANSSVSGTIVTLGGAAVSGSIEQAPETASVRVSSANPLGYFPGGNAPVTTPPAPSAAPAPAGGPVLQMAVQSTAMFDDSKKLAEDGRRLYEMGRLDEAKAKLSEAAKMEPNNTSDQYYLGLTQQAQQAKAAKSQTAEAPAGPNNRFIARNAYVTAPQGALIERESPMEKTSPAPQDIPVPQPEVYSKDNAFSTFSLNVSDVSFKLAAASLEHGQLPPPGGIRSEEFINAFDYRDPEPPVGSPVGFAWDRAGDPFAHNRDLLRFAIKTAAEGRVPGRALNLVLLVDKSGSMERADRVAIEQAALQVLAAQLQPSDTISVVTFARTPRLWMDGVPGNQAGDVFAKIRKITPQGGTNLEEAMRLAYATARRHFLANGMNRVVLFTDGAANLGEVDPQKLKNEVETQRKQGIALDCFGIGWEDYNDDLLEVLSSHGDGRYGFLNTSEEAQTGFAAQLAGAFKVAAADVKAQVEFNPDRVTSWRQIGYAKHQLTKEQFRDNTVDAAVIGAAESGNALYAIQINPAGDGPVATVRVRFRTPGMQDVQEHSWLVPYTGTAVSLDRAAPAMRLAATAGAFAEWLSESPYAAEVMPADLINLLQGVPQVYATDPRPQKLIDMIRQSGSAVIQAPGNTGSGGARGEF